MAGLAIAALVAAIVQAALLAWLISGGERATATVLDSRRVPRNEIDLDVSCTRGLTCVLVALEDAEGRRIEAWAGRGVPQGLLPSPYARGDQVDVVYRLCDVCVLHLGNDYVVKLRTFDGIGASITWCLALACVLVLAAALLRRADTDR